MHRWTAIKDATAGVVLLLAMLDGTVGASEIERDSGAGVVVSGQAGDHFRLENQTIGANWSIADGKISQPDCFGSHAWIGAFHRCADRDFIERWNNLYAGQSETYGQAFDARVGSATGCLAYGRQTARGGVRSSAGEH